MTNNKGYLENKSGDKLYPDQYDSGWIYPTLQNGWTFPTTLRKPAFRKIGNIVYLNGTLISGQYSKTIFTLPVGFRPAADYLNTPIRVATGTGNLFINFEGAGNGVVAIESYTLTGTGQESSLLGISFIAEQ